VALTDTNPDIASQGRGVVGEASGQYYFVIVVVIADCVFTLFLSTLYQQLQKSTNGDRHCTYYLKVREVMIANF